MILIGKSMKVAMRLYGAASTLAVILLCYGQNAVWMNADEYGLQQELAIRVTNSPVAE